MKKRRKQPKLSLSKFLNMYNKTDQRVVKGTYWIALSLREIYVIRYRFNGSTFTIKSLKKIRFHKGQKKRKPMRKVICIDQANAFKPKLTTASTQTKGPVKKKSVAVNCEYQVANKLTQTESRHKEPKKVESKSVETYPQLEVKGTQIHIKPIVPEVAKRVNKGTQTEPLTPETERRKSSSEEREESIILNQAVAVHDIQTICFLNKIGEGLLSQSGLIQNNSALLTKIADLILLLKDPILCEKAVPCEGPSIEYPIMTTSTTQTDELQEMLFKSVSLDNFQDVWDSLEESAGDALSDGFSNSRLTVIIEENEASERNDTRSGLDNCQQPEKTITARKYKEGRNRKSINCCQIS